MTKFKHKTTHEVVFLMGFYVNGKGEKMAQCLCDARLHPFEAKNIHNNTIILNMDYSKLDLAEDIDWDVVSRESYPDGAFEKMVNSKFIERRKSLESSAIAVFKKEFSKCLETGMDEAHAMEIATHKKDEYIAQKMTPPVRSGEPVRIRDINWN